LDANWKKSVKEYVVILVSLVFSIVTAMRADSGVNGRVPSDEMGSPTVELQLVAKDEGGEIRGHDV